MSERECWNCGRVVPFENVTVTLDLIVKRTGKPLSECDECYHARSAAWSEVRTRLNREGLARKRGTDERTCPRDSTYK
jgi:hypothetical protein